LGSIGSRHAGESDEKRPFHHRGTEYTEKNRRMYFFLFVGFLCVSVPLWLIHFFGSAGILVSTSSTMPNSLASMALK